MNPPTMVTRRKLLILGAAGVLVIAGVLLYPRVWFAYVVSRSFQEQAFRIQAAKPIFDATVTRNLNIGDTLAHAKQVLTAAGLDFDVSKDPLPHVLQSIYRVGDGAAFTIHLELGPDDRVTKVDIHESFTGP